MSATDLVLALGGWLSDFTGALFICSGMAKLVAWKKFSSQVRSIGILGRLGSGIFAWSLSVAEVAIGLLAIARIQAAAALAVAFVLLGAFTLFIAWVLRSKREFSCFCFGEKQSRVTSVTLWRNLMLLGLAGVALTATAYGGTLGRWEVGRVLSIGYGFCGVLIFLSGFQLAAVRLERAWNL